MKEYLERFRNKSIFYRILCSYLLLFLIFLISILTFYRIYSAHLKEEIRNGSYVLLEKTQQEVEDRIASCKTILEKVYMDDTFQSSVWQDEQEQMGMMSQYSLKKLLGQWHTRELADLFIYYNYSQRIVSSVNTSTSAGKYLEIYYEAGPKSNFSTSYEAWEKGNEIGNGALRCTTLGTEADTIFVSMYYPAYRTTRPKTVITAVLRPSVVTDAMQGVNEGSLYIYNSQNELLARSGEELEGFRLLSGKGNYYTEQIAGKRYVVQVSQAAASGFSYVHVIPESVFWNKQKEYLKTVLLFMGLFFAVCAGLILWLSKANYAPWKQLVDTVAESTPKPPDGKSENIYLQDAFHETLEQKEIYYKRVQSGKRKETENLFLQYLSLESGGEDFFNLVEEEKYFPLNGPYVLAEFHIESWVRDKVENLGAADTTQLLQNGLSEVLDSIAGTCLCGKLIAQRDRRSFLVLLVLKKDREIEGLEGMLQQTAAILEKTEGIVTTVLVSNEALDKCELPQLFEQLRVCEEYRPVFGRDGLIRFQKVANRSFQYRRNREYIQNYLWDWIRKDNLALSEFDAVQKLIETSLIEESADAESFRLFRKDVLEAMEKLAAQTGIQKDGDGWNRQFELLVQSSFFAEFKLYAAKCLGMLKKFVSTGKQEKDLVGMTVDFIAKEYGNADLNLNYIAEHFHISSQYLSRCFKERYQDSIVDYIAKIRVEHAKEELTNGRDNVETIAFHSGFLSSASFIRTFKKVTGMTPGGYRDQYHS